MQSNVIVVRETPFHVNPLTQFWQILEASRILGHFSPNFFQISKNCSCRNVGVSGMRTEFFHPFFHEI